MSKRKRFKIWLVTGIGTLGVLSMLPLLQYHERKHPIANTESSLTVQMFPKRKKSHLVKPSTAKNALQHGTETDQSILEKPKTLHATIDASKTVPALTKEDTLGSLVDSLSDEEIEELESLTLKDFLSDEELEKLDRKIAESLKEFVALVPKIVEHRAKLDEITVYNNNLAEQESWWEDKETSEKVAKNNELIKEMLNELATLRSQAADLESILLDSDFDSIGTQRDKEWIQQLAEDIWN